MEKFLEELKKQVERECQWLEKALKDVTDCGEASDAIFSEMQTQIGITINNYEKFWLRKKEESLNILREHFEKVIEEIKIKNEQKKFDCEKKNINNIENILWPCLKRENFPDNVKMGKIKEFFEKSENGFSPRIYFSKGKFLNEIEDGIIPKTQKKEKNSTVVKYTQEQIIYYAVSQILLNICTVEERDEILKKYIKVKNHTNVYIEDDIYDMSDIYDIYRLLINRANVQYNMATKMLNDVFENELVSIAWYGQLLGTKFAYKNIPNKTKKLVES